MVFNSPNLSMTATSVLAIVVLAAILLASDTNAHADKPRQIVVSRPTSLSPRRFPVDRSAHQITGSSWLRLRSALPRFGKRHSIPPIIVDGQQPIKTSTTARLKVNCHQPAPTVIRAGRVRLSAFQSDKFQMIDEAVVPVDDADESKIGADNHIDVPSDDEDSEDATSVRKAGESDVPRKRFVPLSGLFASMESIDVGRAAVHNSGPGNEITFPRNSALGHLSAPQIAQSHGDAAKYLWQTPSRTTHHPLYFEDAAAERCGTGQGCLTTWYSAARFFSRIPLVPYMVAADPVDKVVDVATDCVPREAYCFPVKQSGPALVDALAMTAMVFIVP